MVTQTTPGATRATSMAAGTDFTQVTISMRRNTQIAPGAAGATSMAPGAEFTRDGRSVSPGLQLFSRL